MNFKIVSGGQTGVDRAALDCAIELKILHGGWCPKGRLAELGETIDNKYHLTETTSSEPSERTKYNIRDSDGTLIVVPKIPLEITDGTLLTIQEAKDTGKPYLMIDLSQALNYDTIVEWIIQNNITVLNVAGPRESQSPGIYKQSYLIFKEIFNVVLKKIK